MAIQLPEVKRMDTDQPDSVGRIQTQVPDARQDLQQEQSSIAGVAEQAIKYRNDIAHQTADTIATDSSNQFDSWYKEQMYGNPDKGVIGLKFQEGNPTDLFKDFDKRAQGKLNDLAQGQDWSEETQNLVNRRLSRKAQELRDQSLTEYGAQQSKYDDHVTESRVKLSGDAMPSHSAVIDPESIANGDRSTLGPIQNDISEIQNARIAQALRYGGAQLDPNGMSAYTDSGGQEHRVTLGPVTQQKIKEDLSKALHDTTDNLIKSGSNDPNILAKAKVMMNEFGQHIEPLKQGGIQAEFDKAKVKNEAQNLAEAGLHLSTDEFEKSIAGSSVAVKEEARKLKFDQGRFMEGMEKQKETVNYRQAYTAADALLKSNPATTWSMAQQNPVIQNTLASMTPGQRHNVEAMFNPPKISDQFALANAQRFMAGNDPTYPDVTKAPPEYMASLKSKLNVTDRNKLDSTVTKLLDPSSGQLLQQHQDLMRIVQQKAIASGLVSVDQTQGGKVVPGTDAFKRLGDIQSKFTEATKNMGNLTSAQRDEEAGKFVHTLIKGDPTYGQAYEAPKKFQAYGAAFGTTAPPAAANVPKTDKEIRTKAISLWQNMNPANRGVPSKPVLDRFIQDHPEVKK